MSDQSPDTAQPPVDESAWSTASVRPDVDTSDVNVFFRRQSKPVPARHRVAYRTALLVLVLSRFNQHAAKLTNVHTLMWATRTARTRRMFTAWWEGRRFYFTATDRIDPDLQVTLNLALVDGLIEPGTNRTRVQVAEKGRELARRMDELENLLVVEKAFLNSLERLSDGAMERRLTAVVSK
jgi:hypothetical protein